MGRILIRDLCIDGRTALYWMKIWSSGSSGNKWLDFVMLVMNILVPSGRGVSK
jgi:hypothetical protein